MEYKIFTSINITSSWYKSMCQLHGSIFTSQSPESLQEELSWRKKILIVLALDDGKVVGYKIGYEDRQNRFYKSINFIIPNYSHFSSIYS